jgi:hypothetical protein
MAGRKDARAVAVGKDLKEEDRVPHFGKPGVDAEVQAEGLPNLPGSVGGVGSRSHDSGSGRLLRSAKVVEESSAVLG